MKRLICVFLILPPVTAFAGEPLPGRGVAAVKTTQCAGYGPGFVPVEGTTTCIKMSGYVRAEYSWASVGSSFKAGRFSGPAYTGSSGPATTGAILPTSASHGGHTGTLVGGSVDLDARMPTGAGTARAYLRLRADQFNGAISDNH